MDTFIEGFGAIREQGPVEILTAFGLSALLGVLLASVYRWTHSGFTYSRSFVQTQVLACVVATIMILAIGNNMARGLGILGALAIIRFRTPIRDPRDIIFLFASLAVGIASGAGIYAIATIGALVFSACVLILNWVPSSAKRKNEGLLRFVAPNGVNLELLLADVFKHYTTSVEMVAMREGAQGDDIEYAYQVCLADASLCSGFIGTIKQIEEIREANFVMQRETVEI
ncbi:DUF4956 domain-containing protein [Pelagicoccus sp. SDUM812003]|uniref:DUF4956 domain-containing protein n=1 Tax=Pelagicoccus sp. SDUM812003 TaxID=3041267 RepID=UPI00280EEF9B|nr:DUF4956 domain-containing protein [Pelagicoccus sp. SDUM812003]MDQ8202837.1 DUF4956 domain-containing protein [Pelagicoccus sp. SDUM812003]